MATDESSFFSSLVFFIFIGSNNRVGWCGRSCSLKTSAQTGRRAQGCVGCCREAASGRSFSSVRCPIKRFHRTLHRTFHQCSTEDSFLSQDSLEAALASGNERMLCSFPFTIGTMPHMSTHVTQLAIYSTADAWHKLGPSLTPFQQCVTHAHHMSMHISIQIS